MKYIHDYKDGSFCESSTFESKVDNINYLSITDSDYEDLCKGKKLLVNSTIVINTNYKEDTNN